MSAWRTWNLRSWNERLLAYFFRVDGEQSIPVVSLLVSGEELARVTTDANAAADDVRNAFLEAVNIGIRHRKSLLEDATDYDGWPGPPPRAYSPRFVAHLIFTCIAASESSEDFADERSFISRLRTLTRDQLPDSSLQYLPRLWEYLRDWLRINSDRFRTLVLPDLGAFTRIGHTVKLAFPDRRDQRNLSELLDQAGLSGSEPPVAHILSVVSSERGRFRQSFIDAYSEFRHMFETSSSSITQLGLRDHRFWAAVRSATNRNRELPAANDTSSRESLLCIEEDDRLTLFAVADAKSQSSEYGFAELPIAYGPWRFALVPAGTSTIDAQQLQHTVQGLLDGSLRIPSISSQTDQGVLPFIVGPHGLFELASRDQLDESRTALVRTELLSDLMQLFGNESTKVHPSVNAGWTEVRNLDLRTMSIDKLNGTALSRTWILHQSVSPTTIHLRGGVRADDGWLGFHEVLPQIMATGMSEVLLENATESIALERLADGTWRLPSRDFTGSFVLISSQGKRQDRRKILFHATTTRDSFREPKEPSAWIVENIASTASLSNSIPFTAEHKHGDWSQICERTAYLGPAIGSFVPTQEDAAWRVTHFADKFIGSRAAIRGNQSIPIGWVSNANARRRWRKLLLQSVASPSDPTFDEARRQAKPFVLSPGALPRLEIPQTIPDISPVRLSAHSEQTERLVRIIAGRAAARSGIDYREWAELAKTVLRIDSVLIERITRAWKEAGLIDIAVYARWRYRALFARPATIVAFEVGDRFGATISGLVPRTTMDEIRIAAQRIGILVEDKLSVSPLVPGTISLRAPDVPSLTSLAESCRISLNWLDPSCLQRPGSTAQEAFSPPPEHYEHRRRWLKWSLRNNESTEVEFEHRSRPDRPDYWLVSNGRLDAWSLDLNVARAWAAVLLGAPIVVPEGDTSLEAHHAFVPLAVARATSIVGAGLPGPVDSGYRYPLGTTMLRNLTLNAIAQAFAHPSL